jgi:PAS domain S-box-containing protein
MNLRAGEEPSPRIEARDPLAAIGALHRVGQLAACAGEMRPALADALRILCELFGWPAGQALVTSAEQQLSMLRVFFAGPAASCATLREACERAPLGALRARPAWVELEGDPRGAAALSCGIRAALACPIIAAGEVAGFIELFSPSAERPDEARMLAAEEAAVQLGRVVERLGAARRVKSGEDVFLSLCEALPLGVLVTDAEGALVYSNPAFEAVAGFPAEDTAPAVWAPLLHERDRARVVEAWNRLLKDGNAIREDFRTLRDKDLRVFGYALRAPGGKLRGHVLVLEDLTERLAAEEALHASEERFRAIFEYAGVGIALSNMQGELVRVNRAYARFLGYLPEEMAGRSAREVVHPESLPETLRAIREMEAGTRTSFENERRYRRRDGSTVWGRVTATPLAQTGLLLAVVQDIDLRKRAEDAVRKLSGRILHMQDDERRRIARSLHESAAQTVAALSMNLQRMERMQLSPQAAETLADSLELVTECSREIRTLSHLLHPPLMEEAGLPASLRWYVQGFAARSNVEVDLQIADDIGRLPTELEITLFRVVQESLTNVHRHSGSKIASIHLRRHGPEVVLEVVDKGIGVPPDMLDRVSTSSAASVGVGIAGMRERLSQLGGSLELDSSPQGTLVRARLRSDR